MAQVQKSVLVNYSAQQMFDLVDRVEDYPQFLPWCGGSEVKRRDELVTIATIQIDYLQVKQSFTTENTKQTPHLMHIKLQNGPFKQLDGSWRFTELNPTACKIEFSLHYEFSNRLLEIILGPVFSHIANSLVDAFVLRAEKIYPTP